MQADAGIMGLTLREMGWSGVLGAGMQFLLLWSRGLDDLQCDARDACADHLKLLGGPPRDVYDAAHNEWTAVIDAHDNRLAGSDPCHSNARTKRQGPGRRREFAGCPYRGVERSQSRTAVSSGSHRVSHRDK